MIITLENRFFSLRSAVCFFVEGGIILFSVVASFLLLYGRAGTPVVSMGDVVARALVITFFCQTCMYLLDLYNFRFSQTWGETLFSLAIAIGFVCVGIGLLSYAIPRFGVAGKMYYLSILFASVLLLIWRILFEIYITRFASHENILIVGTGEVARKVGEEVTKNKRLGFRLVGFINAPPAKNGSFGEQVGDILGDSSQMDRIIKRHAVDKVVVAITERRGEYPVKEMLALRVGGYQVLEWPGFFEKISGRIPIDNLAPSFFIFNEGFRKSKILLSVRRILSTIVSAVFLVLLIPFYIVVSIIIKLDSSGPVLYSQIRVGQHNKPIRIYKFRSMRNDAEKNGDAVWAMENDPRVTRVGRFLRKTRIDELPQLYNVTDRGTGIRRPPPGASGIRGETPGPDPVLLPSPHGQTGDHRMGAGHVPLQRNDRRVEGKAPVRSFLHQEHVAQDGPPDPVSNLQNRPLGARGEVIGLVQLPHSGPITIRNAFTVDVEEYFQVEAFSDRIPKQDWHKFPSRVEETTKGLLELLETHRVRGTFFVLGWIARNHPTLVETIYKAGHEVASHGFDHSMITEMTPEAFRLDIRKSKAILEGITGTPVNGYRAPTFSITEKTSWAHEILLQEGYSYSSSVFPVWHDRYGWPKFGNDPRQMASGKNGEIWEIPLTVGSIGPFRVPFGGGGYLRAYPLTLTNVLFRRLERDGRHGVVYIHPWELDTRQPAIQAPFFRRLRHHIGIPKMRQKLIHLLRTMQFGTVAQLLEANPAVPNRRPVPPADIPFVDQRIGGR